MVCLREWPLRSRRTDVWYAAILPTRKIFCLLAFFHMAKQSRFPGENAFARVEQTCANRDDKIAPRHQKAFREISKWRGESLVELRIKIDISSFPFKRAISRNRRPVKRRESKKPRFPIVFRMNAQSPFDLGFFSGSRLALHGQ